MKLNDFIIKIIVALCYTALISGLILIIKLLIKQFLI